MPGKLTGEANRLQALVVLFLAALPASAAAPPVTLGDLVGAYYLGDGLGENVVLEIKADGTFSWQRSGCLGVYGEAAGSVTLQDGDLVLEPPQGENWKEPPELPLRFTPVRWGRRLYLVPTNDLVGFSNEVNSGHEPRQFPQGDYFLRRKDWKKAVSGPLHLPDRKPLPSFVEAVILGRLDDGSFQINAGRRQGLFRGRVLFASGRDPEPFHCRLTVTAAVDDTATAKGEELECERVHAGSAITGHPG